MNQQEINKKVFEILCQLVGTPTNCSKRLSDMLGDLAESIEDNERKRRDA